MFQNLKLMAGISILMAFAVLSTMTMYYRGQYQTTKAAYDEFVSKAQVLAAQQLAENQRKEKLYEDMVHTAYAARDVAIARMQHNQDIARASRMSVTPTAAPGTDRICFSRAKLDGAIQSFLADVQGLAATGDSAIIVNRMAVAAWPK